MNFKTYTTQNVPVIRSGKPTMRINLKAGLFSLSKTLCQDLNIDETSKIKFAQDEDKPADWYLILSSDDDAFPLRSDKSGQCSLNNTSMAKLIISTIPSVKEKSSFSMLVSTIPYSDQISNVFAILTKSAS